MSVSHIGKFGECQRLSIEDAQVGVIVWFIRAALQIETEPENRTRRTRAARFS
jgi:hypothetical protein